MTYVNFKYTRFYASTPKNPNKTYDDLKIKY